MLVIIFFGVLIFQEIHASEIKVKSFDIEKYEIVMFSNQIILKLSIVPSIDGNFQYFIHAPSQMKKASIQYKDSTYNSIHGNNINKEWMFNIPEDGYYFIETAVKVIPKIIEQQYSYFSVHTLYFEIKDRNIINFSNEIDTNFYKFKRLEMDSSTAIINNRTLKNDTKEELQRKVISVHISGNISFEDFKLSESSDICIYNNKHDFIIGPFNSRFNKKHGIYSTHLTMGEDIVVDLFEPIGEIESSKFTLSKVVYGYREFSYDESNLLKSEKYEQDLQSVNCLLYVNCPEGNNWCREKFSVTKLNKYFKFNV
jgi:hypothetical protein